MTTDAQRPYHISVMVAQVLEYLALKKGGVYVDATFGGGGHTRALLSYDPTIRVIAFDWDAVALETNGEALKKEFGDRLTLVWSNFVNIDKKLKSDLKITAVDGILADFGTSQFQLHERAGFSFYNDTSLDMRMSPSHQTITAQQIINGADERTLADIFYYYGEEPKSRILAKVIVQERKKRPITTTGQLAEIAQSVIGFRGSKKKKIHPATQIFQALRIYVNKELDNIKEFLPAAISMLNEDGRLVCISFHSLEDRIVKQYFKERALAQPECFEIVTKKVVTADGNEVQNNPASRSACLRALQVKKRC